MKNIKRKQSGFTLVEIAIVLVIIGLLLGGVLKGQELITNARVRNLASQTDGLKAAYFAFQDRYRAFPGDYIAAQANVNIPPMGGVANAYTGNGGGTITGAETGQAVRMLNAAGFINCSTCTNFVNAGASNSPVNVYGGWLVFITDAVYDDATLAVARNNLKSGSLIPVGVIAELDRKIDDGNAQGGIFRFSAAANPTAPTPAQCEVGGIWQATLTTANCGAASML